MGIFLNWRAGWEERGQQACSTAEHPWPNCSSAPTSRRGLLAQGKLRDRQASAARHHPQRVCSALLAGALLAGTLLAGAAAVAAYIWEVQEGSRYMLLFYPMLLPRALLTMLSWG